MKAGEAIKKITSRPFNLLGLKPSDLAPFRKFLEEKGYNEKNIYSKLKGKDIYETHYLLSPLYNEVYLKDLTDLNCLIRLFFINSTVKKERLVELFGEEMFGFLHRVGIIRKSESGYRSDIAIFSCRGRYICTDHRFENLCPKNAVYPLGLDSMGLARGIVERPVGEALDLCTGSGVQGVVAARHAGRVTCIDINPRAVEFVKLNTLLNGLDNVEVKQGNLFEPVKGRKFDLITVNPPFVPSPEKERLLFRDGNTTGEEVLMKVINHLDEYLTDDGLCQIYSLIPIMDREFNDKVQEWLGKKGFHVLTMVHLTTNIHIFLKSHVNPVRDYMNYYEKMANWARSMVDAGIKETAYGLINISRANKSSPQIRWREFNLPAYAFSDRIETQLELMENAENEAFHKKLDDMEFRLNPHIDFIWDGKKLDGAANQGLKYYEDEYEQLDYLTDDEMRMVKDVYHGIIKGEYLKAEYTKGGRSTEEEYYKTLMELMERVAIMEKPFD